MNSEVLASKRFWFGVMGALVGFLVIAFAGDPSVPGWVVKLLGGVNAACAMAVSLLQNSDAKATAKKRDEATREHKAMG